MMPLELCQAIQVRFGSMVIVIWDKAYLFANSLGTYTPFVDDDFMTG